MTNSSNDSTKITIVRRLAPFHMQSNPATGTATSMQGRDLAEASAELDERKMYIYRFALRVWIRSRYCKRTYGVHDSMTICNLCQLGFTFAFRVDRYLRWRSFLWSLNKFFFQILSFTLQSEFYDLPRSAPRGEGVLSPSSPRVSRLFHLPKSRERETNSDVPMWGGPRDRLNLFVDLPPSFPAGKRRRNFFA